MSRLARWGRLYSADHQAFPGSIDHGRRDGGQAVYAQDPFDLREQAVDEAEVAAADPDDCGDCFRVRNTSWRQSNAKLRPVGGEQVADFLGAQWSEGVDKADPGVELRIASQALFHAGHADQHQAGFAVVEEIAELLKAGTFNRSASSTRIKRAGVNGGEGGATTGDGIGLAGVADVCIQSMTCNSSKRL
jgi:hypothetical protein